MSGNETHCHLRTLLPIATSSGSSFLKKPTISGAFIRTPEQGAATMLAVALNPEYQKYTGTFFKKEKPCKPNKKYTDNIKEQKMLQAMTEKILAENNIILPQF